MRLATTNARGHLRKERWLGIALIAAVLGGAACGSDRVDPVAPPVIDGGAAADANPTRPPRRELCVDGQSVDGAYPKAEYRFDIAGTLPDLEFETAGAPVTLREFFEPCAPASRLLVLRVTAEWCGTCLWHAAHTKALSTLD